MGEIKRTSGGLAQGCVAVRKDFLARLRHRGENLKVRSEQDFNINKRGSKRDIRHGACAALAIART